MRAREAAAAPSVKATLAVLGVLAVAVAHATPAPAAQFFGRRTIARFAPVLVLHPRERDLPTSGKGFLNNANLGFSHAGACGRDAAIYSRPWSGEAIARLGSGGFRERLTGPPPRCRDVGDPFTTTD